MSEARLNIDALSRDQKARLYDEMRSADAERKRLRREDELQERERFRVKMRRDNLRRRIGRLRDELKEREEEVAPAREAIAAPEPERDDFTVYRDWYDEHGKWFQLKHSAEEFLASKIGRIETLKRVIAEGDEELAKLEAKMRAIMPGPGF